MSVEDIQLDREDIILLILEANERLLRKNALNGITRLEKLLFLLDRESTFVGIGRFFVFEPHNFGPFSKEVYEAVDFLEGCELIEISERSFPSPYARADEDRLTAEISDEDSQSQVTELRFSLTSQGRKVATIIRNAVAYKRRSDVDEIDSLVRKYGTRPLNHLIRYVYHQYPDMTSKSIHPEAANVARHKSF